MWTCFASMSDKAIVHPTLLTFPNYRQSWWQLVQTNPFKPKPRLSTSTRQNRITLQLKARSHSKTQLNCIVARYYLCLLYSACFSLCVMHSVTVSILINGTYEWMNVVAFYIKLFLLLSHFVLEEIDVYKCRRQYALWRVQLYVII